MQKGILVKPNQIEKLTRLSTGKATVTFLSVKEMNSKSIRPTLQMIAKEMNCSVDAVRLNMVKLCREGLCTAIFRTRTDSEIIESKTIEEARELATKHSGLVVSTVYVAN